MERLKSVAFLQALGIILVVIGHSYDQNISHLGFLKVIIYSFHMPLFIFISGFLFKYTHENFSNIKVGEFILNKFKRLLVPYLVISTLAYFPKIVLSKFAMRPIEFSLAGYIKGLIYPFENPIIFFWFLPTLFIIFTVIILLSRIAKLESGMNQIFLLVISLGLGFLIPIDEFQFLNLSGVVHYLPYFILGIFFCSHKNKFNNNRVIMKISSPLLLSLLIIENNYFRVTILTAFTGILASFIAANFYELKEKHSLFISSVSNYSFQIYLLSWFPQTFIRILLYEKLSLNFYLVFAISIISGIITPILVMKIIESVINSKYILLIFGTKPKLNYGPKNFNFGKGNQLQA